jgi:hypothetical protein
MTVSASGLLGSGLLVLWGHARPGTDEDALNDWWTHEHLPERLAVPGFVRARRYARRPSPSDATEYLTVYEGETIDTFSSPGYMSALNNPTPRTKANLPSIASMDRSACRVLHSVVREGFGGAVGGSAIFAHFNVGGGQQRKDLQDWIIAQLTPTVIGKSGSLALHLVERDEKTTKTGSSSSSYDGIDLGGGSRREEQQTQWILLIEAAWPPSSREASRKVVEEDLEGLKSRGAVDIHLDLYDLLCATTP